MKCLPVLLFTAALLSACANFDAFVASPQGQADEAALNAGLSTAEALSPIIYPAATPGLQAATFALRTVEGAETAPPTAATLTSTIASIAGSPQVAAALSPSTAKTIADAVKVGIPIATAIEGTASLIDAKVAPSAATASRATAYRRAVMVANRAHAQKLIAVQ